MMQNPPLGVACRRAGRATGFGEEHVGEAERPGRGPRSFGKTPAGYPRYSQRNARIGSIAVARRAGIYPASAVTAAIPSEAAAMDSKSVGGTPNNCV